MVAPVVLIGAAVLAKGTAAVWLMSRATSPLSAPWRKEFLDGTELELKKLEELGQIDAHRLEKLRFDIQTLRPKVEKGWSAWHLYSAASRIASFRGLVHTKSGLAGTWDLVCNTVNQAVDSAFPPPRLGPDHQGKDRQ